MSSNPNQKKDAADGTRRRRTLYFINIIFLSCVAILSLLFALAVGPARRLIEKTGKSKLYTDSQIQSVRDEAAQEGKEELLGHVRTSLQSGRSMLEMLRELYDEDIVVRSGEKYLFFPVLENIEKNPLSKGALTHMGAAVSCRDDSLSVQMTTGVLLSERNGKIDWDRLAYSGIDEVFLSAGTVTGSGFAPDEQLSRNLRKAREKGIPCSLSVEIQGAAGTEIMEEAAAGVLAAAAEQGDGAGGTILLRLNIPEALTDPDRSRQVLTGSLQSLCGLLQEEGLEPVIGASQYVFADRIDLSAFRDLDRWLIDPEEKVLFPYSFRFWEYSSEGAMKGVPGNSILFVRLQFPELEIRQDGEE